MYSGIQKINEATVSPEPPVTFSVLVLLFLLHKSDCHGRQGNLCTALPTRGPEEKKPVPTGQSSGTNINLYYLLKKP